jgi:hypothetical protein
MKLKPVICPVCKKHTFDKYPECLSCGSKLKSTSFGINSNLSKSSHFYQQVSWLESLIYLIVIAGFIYWKANDFSSTSTVVNPNEVQACVSRGVKYFKEIGSYPVLVSEPNAGRRAEDVARERCNRGIHAF